MSSESFDYSEQYKKLYEAWEKTMSEAIDVWKKNPLVKTGVEETEDYDPMEQYKSFTTPGRNHPRRFWRIG